MEEYFYDCPYCFSEVSILIDTTLNEQEYIEDCERCCNPIDFRFTLDANSEIQDFSANPIGQ
jgi:hypothetical protein